ncbi:MAG: hypothetical protein CVU05_02690 [Bacteroidetes bacterium HGW-Bacteroidetes-21]|jgi:hypothetical protein|nr:MAG: hypothetical protein CVU05_02690 [Bacteroidetes bacterium HGW-Bacteroidetes-21]
MKNDTCVICGEKFEPREKKLYCSDSCKQKAFLQRKEKENNPETPEIIPEQKIIKKNIIIFDYQEYKSVLEKLPYKFTEWLLFERYCFFRKNLSGEPIIEDIIEYLMLYERDICSDTFNSYNCHYREPFDLFLNDFHNEEKYIIKLR